MVSRRSLVIAPLALAFGSRAHSDFSIDAQSDFGGLPHTRLREILAPVESLLMQWTGKTPRHAIEVYARPQGPKVDLVGQVQRIGLSAGGRDYMRQVYQFAHEYTHVLTNWQDSKARRYKWLEETLCELASLHVICHFALLLPFGGYTTQQWLAYVNRIIDDHAAARYQRHGIGESTPPRTWYPKVRQHLASDSLIRELNAGIARALLAPFIDRPALWRAASLLNQWDTAKDRDMRRYLDSWTLACLRHGESPDAPRLIARVLFGS